MSAANTSAYVAPEPMPLRVKGSKDLSVKPRVRPMGDHMLVTLACGSTATMREVPAEYGSGREYTLDDLFWNGQRQRFSTFENAVRAAGRRSKLVLEPIMGDGAAKWRELAAEVDRDIDACCKVLRKLLRERTGRDWSVSRGRGTAYSWLTITSPPKRRAMGRHGRSSQMSVEDQILLSAALGSPVHDQGESIRTECGVRGAYVFRIAGVPIPDDWHVAEPSWD